MKKSIILILLYVAVTASNSSDAYFFADTNSIAPVAYYAEDSLSKRIGHVNPISTVSVISSIAAPLVVILGYATYNLWSFDPLTLAAILFIFGLVGGIIGLVVRKKLMIGKYANYPDPKKLPLGQGRSWIGIIVSVLVGVLVAIVSSIQW